MASRWRFDCDGQTPGGLSGKSFMTVPQSMHCFGITDYVLTLASVTPYGRAVNRLLADATTSEEMASA
jgi:hypothetical protein